MPTSTATDAKAGPKRPIWKRLIASQEAGLVLVIVLMGAMLAIFGGNKTTQYRIELDESTKVLAIDQSGQSHGFGSIPLPQVKAFRIDRQGSEPQTYSRAEGYRYDASQGVIFGEHQENKFLDDQNLVNVAKDASFIAIMAVGMTGVIILAGIDLSVGSIYGLSALMGALALHALPADAGLWVSLPVGLGVSCLVGLLCGLLNGVMIVGLRVHSFVITLGTMAAFRGILFVKSQGQSIGGFPESYTSGFFRGEIGGTQPVPVLVMLAVVAAGFFVLAKTVVGRQVYAIGGNETAARYAGIPVGRVKIIVFSMLGLLCGLSAAIYLGYYGAAEPNAGQAYELKVIAATVIGGASLMGGRGSAIGAVLGAIVIQLIDNGMIILRIDQSYNQIVMGSAIIVAVVIDQAKARLAPKG